MLIEDVILTAIINEIIGYTIEKGAGKLGDRVKEKLGLDPTRKALKEALGGAFEQLNRQHPQWVASNFDASFFQHEGAPILAQFLLMDGQPDASELASLWADSLNIQNPERRAFYIRELEPIAVDFLEDLAHQLKGKEVLRDLNISRAIDATTEALQALRRQFGAEKATFGTRQDYLRWLIGRNLYLDSRGVFQTQRQVQVKLADVYISLQAQYGDALSTADRQVFEQERAELEEKAVIASLAAEEREDRYDELQMRFDRRLQREKPAEILELADAVTRYERVVILGDPGSGKSTLLRYLALKHAEALRDGHTSAGTGLGVPRFPILLRIAEYAEADAQKRQSLSEFLAHCYEVHECPKQGLADLLQSELDEGNCLVLLDGLDEIASSGERLDVVRQIEDFVRRYGGKSNRFVITSRIAGYRSAQVGESFTHYTVREMNKPQMRRFLERWCQAVEDAETPELSLQERTKTAKREIDGIMRAVQNPGVRRLASNPLLLRILALIHRTGAKLPQRRIELYKLAADALARTWRPAQGVPESALVLESALLKEDFLTPLLSTLAYWLHENKPTGTATEREVYGVLGEAWARLNDLRWDPDDPNPKITEEIRKFLVAIHKHTGLFVERAPKRYGFMHLTFEEYYTARYLVARSRTRARLIREHLHAPRWEEPILLALGFVGLEYPTEAGELVETAILAKGDEAQELRFPRSPYEELLGQDYLFALRCLGDNIPVRPRLLNQLSERLAKELLYNAGSARFSRYRQALDEKLSYLGGSEGAVILLPHLITALRDADAIVRSQAARNLWQLGQASSEVVAALLAALRDADVRVRYQAAESLGLLGQTSSEAVAALLGALHDTDANVRIQAAGGLGHLGQTSSEVVASLLMALGDADAMVRYQVAGSLGQSRQTSSEVVAALLMALGDAAAIVRSQAAWGLGQLEQTSSEVIAALLMALGDVDGSVRYQAARSLGQLRRASSEVVAALLVVLRDAAAMVRYQAAVSLGQLGQVSTEIIVVIGEGLRVSDISFLRAALACLLGQVGQGDSATIDLLWSCLLDEDHEVRTACASALAQLGKRYATIRQLLEASFVRAIQDSKFNERDSWGRTAKDYVYDGLWSLVVSSEIEEK